MLLLLRERCQDKTGVILWITIALVLGRRAFHNRAVRGSASVSARYPLGTHLLGVPDVIAYVEVGTRSSPPRLGVDCPVDALVKVHTSDSAAQTPFLLTR